MAGRRRFPSDNGRTKAGERYDVRHRRARVEAAKVHSPEHPCSRCGHALGPMGPWLHLDHDDNDATRYLGFAHGSRPCPICGHRCNIRAGAQLGNARQQANNPRRLPRW